MIGSKIVINRYLGCASNADYVEDGKHRTMMLGVLKKKMGEGFIAELLPMQTERSSDFIMKRLPKKPSSLIRLALKDLRAVELDDRYIVEMGEWHTPIHEEGCAVCFAGSVMAKSLDAPIFDNLWPSNFYGGSIKNPLFALNEIREGFVLYFFDSLSVRKPDGLEDMIDVPDYHDSPEEFHTVMDMLADHFEEIGL